MPTGGPFGLRVYGILGAVKTEFPGQPHDVARAMPLTKESNGYCPICGHWSIITNVLVDEATKIKGDICRVCNTVFDVSELEFIDSQTCTCGHPKSDHENDALSCIKGKELENCQCDKYRPTEVKVKESPIEEKQE